ncbi:hypothetical protein LUZ63_013142 [Rhynchospora breviuscula]|uniref:Late embryogenesis abundant protein LEA-2 subgroup domain-containing protein n=1 Tax=Rhynchospora breviuscula TaxID=2022672 RepID=A0A9Q0C867_9POAL|nr:hypothetical protein LUZ63_013142 [Rhynchospora breviuscula]
MEHPINPSEKTKLTHPFPPLSQPPCSHSPSTSSSGSVPVYMLQFPRDHVLKMPSEDVQQQYKNYTKYKPIQRRIQRGCCHCLCTSICLIVILLVTVGCILYFGFRPKAPTYSLTNLSISGFEPLLTSSVTPIDPSIVATVKTENPNKKLSILYQTNGIVSVYFDSTYLCSGDWPSFRQGPQNVTIFETNLTGSGILLTALNRDSIVKAETNGSVPLTVYAKVPVKLKFSFITSWVITVRVTCDVAVTTLTSKAAILSKKCHIKTHYLW